MALNDKECFDLGIIKASTSGLALPVLATALVAYGFFALNGS